MRRNLSIFLTLALVTGGAAAAAAELETADEIRRCAASNAPDLDNVQAVELIARDRLGGERVVEANIYTRRDPQGFRRVLVRFTRPEDLDGAAFLLIQRADANELIVRSPDLGNVKRIAQKELMGSIAGTDFSYEDFTRLQRVSRPAALVRLPDEELDGHSVYVLESRPPDPSSSAYERIRAYIDQDTCVVVRSELYEVGDKLRKVMTTPRERFRKLGAVWVANEVLLQDLRDGTQTRMVVESFDVDAEVPASIFSVESLAEPPPGKPGG